MTRAQKSLDAALQAIESEFELDQHDLDAILERFMERMRHGLAHDGQDMAMIPSFVTGVPSGTEEGTYLALDLGGTNLRVCEVILDGKGSFKMKQEKYKVSEELKTGRAHDLFGFIAQCVKVFLKQESEAGLDKDLFLGFTFSFPVEQTAIDRGTLIKWTKGFNCPDAVGKEVVSLLQGCLDELGVKVRVNALVNDTVGALLAHGYQSKGPALLGAIFGTGTNGAYVEERGAIVKLQVEDPLDPVPQTMIINAEWGGFDDERHVLPVLPYDNVVDRTSIRPRHHAFEKMISGMYLGEITRIVLLSLIDDLVLFQGYSSVAMNTQYAFDTAYMSTIMADTADASDAGSATRKVLVETMDIDKQSISAADVSAVRRVCDVVGERAARLSAVAVAAVLKHHIRDGQGDAVQKNTRDQVYEVGVDGSVVEFLPRFLDRLRSALMTMVGKDVASKTRFGYAKDGSGVGAALCALQAQKQQASHHHPHLHGH